jgi:putative RNA 2'-phosphotransferase
MSATRSSKFLSLILRHEPARVGITLDPSGWTDVDALLAALARHGHPLTREQLAELVASSDKQRFAMSADGTRIRANQGHSVDVELGLPPATPPTFLFHGTVASALEGIQASGLEKRSRHHVHLSSDLGTATKVGSRRGAPILLTIRAADMVAAGHVFFRSENGVWLTDRVPAEFIDFPSGGDGVSESLRDVRIRMARTTVMACEARAYTSDRGQQVSLSPALQNAVAGTKLYQHAPEVPSQAGRAAPIIRVTEETTGAAVLRLAAGPADPARHVGCLNYASAKNPGGGFLSGAQAQEEAIARTSALYPCLLAQPSYYEQNRQHRSALYLDLVIYSPKVPFFRDDSGNWLDAPSLASVITAPAPNASALRQHGELDAQALRQTLHRRARIVLAIAAAEGVTHLVLGAWGAGVFGNDPVEVAEAFAAALDELGPAFTEVIFAIPPGPNHDPFARRFWSQTRPS